MVSYRIRQNKSVDSSSLKAQHFKSKYLECSELKTAEYIKDERLNDNEKKLLFKLRSKTLDVKKKGRFLFKLAMDFWLSFLCVGNEASRDRFVGRLFGWSVCW